MPVLLLAFLTAFILAFFAIPSIIQIAGNYQIYGNDERSTPSLGGLVFFMGTFFATIWWLSNHSNGDIQYTFCALFIVSIIGIKDDVHPLTPSKKLTAQTLAASIIVLKSHILLYSLYDLFRQNIELPYWLSISITIISILVITNAFNLIDGIDGLAASIGLFIVLSLGSWFYLTGIIEYAILSISFAGSLIAFLIYNIAPARVLMGDTGSLFLGLIIAVLSIQFVNINYNLPITTPYHIQEGLSMISALLIVPLFDIGRVFTLRMLQRKNPFKPDMQHIHHLLLDYGLAPRYAIYILVAFTMSMVVICILLNSILNTGQLLILQIVIATLLSYRLRTLVIHKRGVNSLKFRCKEH